jgi:hypothetical protein
VASPFRGSASAGFPVALLTEPRGPFLSFDHAKSHRLFLHRRFSRSSLSSLAYPVAAPPSPFRSTSPVLHLNPNLVSAFLSTARSPPSLLHACLARLPAFLSCAPPPSATTAPSPPLLLLITAHKSSPPSFFSGQHLLWSCLLRLAVGWIHCRPRSSPCCGGRICDRAMSWPYRGAGCTHDTGRPPPDPSSSSLNCFHIAHTRRPLEATGRRSPPPLPCPTSTSAHHHANDRRHKDFPYLHHLHDSTAAAI